MIAALFVALGLLSVQTWMIWSSRDAPLRAAAAARRLDACAAIGATTTDFLAKAAIARREAARGSLGVRTFEIVRDAPQDVARTVFVARYLLPDASEDTLVTLQNTAQAAVTAAFQGDGDRLQRLIDQFEAAARTVQETCRELATDGGFAS